MKNCWGISQESSLNAIKNAYQKAIQSLDEFLTTLADIEQSINKGEYKLTPGQIKGLERGKVAVYRDLLPQRDSLVKELADFEKRIAKSAEANETTESTIFNIAGLREKIQIIQLATIIIYTAYQSIRSQSACQKTQDDSKKS